MECYEDVPGVLGPRPVWVTFVGSAAEWRGLVADEDWDRLIERERRPFGILTASSDPRSAVTSWLEFADYCVERELMLVASWGANSTLLDDLFDEAAVARSVDHLPGSMPMTSWHDDEPLEETLEFFLSSSGADLRRGFDHDGTEWVRVIVVVGDQVWLDEVRSALLAGATAG